MQFPRILIIFCHDKLPQKMRGRDKSTATTIYIIYTQSSSSSSLIHIFNATTSEHCLLLPQPPDLSPSSATASGSLSLIHLAAMAKPRNSRFPSRRSTPSSTLILTMLLIFSFVVLILLGLGILSMPGSNKNAPKAHDLTSIVRKTADRYLEIWNLW